MSSEEVACTYACLLLHDDGVPVTADKIREVLKAANVKVDSYWPGLFAKLCEKMNIEDLILNSGSGCAVPAPASSPEAAAAVSAPSAAAVETKKEEEKAEESDEDGALFDLFA